MIAVRWGMRGFCEYEPKRLPGGASGGDYMVCAGGYPREALPTFAAAEARAWDLAWFEPESDFTIYEVETGIHFDLPKAARTDEGVMPAVFDAAFERGHPMR